MKNIELINLITQVIGAIAVVISIIYLAKQIKLNTRALKAQASFDSNHALAEFNQMLTEVWASDTEFQQGKEARITAATVCFYNPEGKIEDLSPTEFMILTLGHRTIFQKFEGMYYMFKQGLLEPDIWYSRRNWAHSLVNLPIPKHWWQIEQTQSLYTEEFMQMISQGIKTDIYAPGKG